MAGSTQAFRPTGGVSVAASTVTASANLPTGGDTLLVYNAAGDVAFVVVGGGTLTAAAPTSVAGAAGVPIPSGQSMVLDCPATVTEVAVVLNSGTGTVFATRGHGSAH